LEKKHYFIERKILAKQQFFRNLESEQLASLVDCAEKRAFCKGSDIIVQGKEGNTMFILISGTVKVLKNGLYITSMEAGALFGEVALLYNCMRTAQIEAESDVHVWIINRKHFQAAIRSAGQSKG
jgi:cGMP-dependent protein kinase